MRVRKVISKEVAKRYQKARKNFFIESLWSIIWKVKLKN